MNLHQQESSERTRWSFAALLTTACSILLLSLSLLSCSTFEKARLKYSTNVVDTTFTTYKTVVPKDSVVLRLVTDTTTVVHEIRQGRARIIYQRNPATTVIRADCDSVIVERKVPVYIEKQVWGVDSKYRDKARTWQTVAFVLIGLIGAGVIAYVFTYRLKLDVSKR